MKSTSGRRDGQARADASRAGEPAIPSIALIEAMSLRSDRCEVVLARVDGTDTAPRASYGAAPRARAWFKRTDAEPAIAVGLEWNAVDAAWLSGDLLHVEEVGEQLAAGPNRRFLRLRAQIVDADDRASAPSVLDARTERAPLGESATRPMPISGTAFASGSCESSSAGATGRREAVARRSRARTRTRLGRRAAG
jgi:hypothetical protein